MKILNKIQSIQETSMLLIIICLSIQNYSCGSLLIHLNFPNSLIYWFTLQYNPMMHSIFIAKDVSVTLISTYTSSSLPSWSHWLSLLNSRYFWIVWSLKYFIFDEIWAPFIKCRINFLIINRLKSKAIILTSISRGCDCDTCHDIMLLDNIVQ